VVKFGEAVELHRDVEPQEAAVLDSEEVRDDDRAVLFRNSTRNSSGRALESWKARRTSS